MKNKKWYLIVSLKALVVVLQEISALRRAVCLKIPAFSKIVIAETSILKPKYFQYLPTRFKNNFSICALLIAQDEQLITMVYKEYVP